ncbi:hypothetical protein HOY82DRAFT_632826 [Tuber indicum]|nr:hypothetical protein HOY82DRAFT_632826 [Tuber indicum]
MSRVIDLLAVIAHTPWPALLSWGGLDVEIVCGSSAPTILTISLIEARYRVCEYRIPRNKEGNDAFPPRPRTGIYHWIIVRPHDTGAARQSRLRYCRYRLALQPSPISVPRTRVRDAPSIREPEPPTHSLLPG